jgi:hypothetical protein
MDPMDAIGVHVVGETAGTADPRDEDNILAGHPLLRENLLHLGENRVIAAAGAPASVLVAGEIVWRQYG